MCISCAAPPNTSAPYAFRSPPPRHLQRGSLERVLLRETIHIFYRYTHTYIYINMFMCICIYIYITRAMPPNTCALHSRQDPPLPRHLQQGSHVGEFVLVVFARLFTFLYIHTGWRKTHRIP